MNSQQVWNILFKTCVKRVTIWRTFYSHFAFGMQVKIQCLLTCFTLTTESILFWNKYIYMQCKDFLKINTYFGQHHKKPIFQFFTEKWLLSYWQFKFDIILKSAPWYGKQPNHKKYPSNLFTHYYYSVWEGLHNLLVAIMFLIFQI